MITHIEDNLYKIDIKLHGQLHLSMPDFMNAKNFLYSNIALLEYEYYLQINEANKIGQVKEIIKDGSHDWTAIIEITDERYQKELSKFNEDPLLNDIFDPFIEPVISHIIDSDNKIGYWDLILGYRLEE